MKEPIYQFNSRVEFKDTENVFHVGFVKRVRKERRWCFRHRWSYDVCEYVKGSHIRKVYTIPEDNIFGVIERKEREIKQPNNE